MRYARIYTVTLPSLTLARLRKTVYGSPAMLAILSARLASALESTSRRCTPSPPSRSAATRFALVAEEPVRVGIEAEYWPLVFRLVHAWKMPPRAVIAAVLRADLTQTPGQAAA